MVTTTTRAHQPVHFVYVSALLLSVFPPSQILNEARQNFEDLSGSQSSCISDEVSYMRAVAFTFCVRFTVI